jgi:hypothetical protein
LIEAPPSHTNSGIKTLKSLQQSGIFLKLTAVVTPHLPYGVQTAKMP